MLQFQTVLCPVDFTPLSKPTLQLAVEVCRKLRARLVLEHNLDTVPPSSLGVSWMWEEEHESSAEKTTEWATERLRELFREIPDDLEYEAKLTHGPLHDALLMLAEQLPVDLIVMGTHGPNSGDRGSQTERAILEAPCPVLTLGEGYDPASVMSAMAGEAPESMTVVVPYDFSERARAALRFGLALGETMPHHLSLVHVVSEGHGRHKEEKLEEAVESARSRLRDLVPEAFAGRMSVEVKRGEEVEGILETAEDEDAIFILMPAQRKSLVKRFLFGTTTVGVLHGSECPVLFVPPAYELPSQSSA